MRTAVLPGSFDPITVGHLDLAARAAALFDRVILCVMINGEKRSLFTMEQRLEMARAALAGIPNARAEAWDGLLADFARERGAAALVKGAGGGGFRLGAPAGPDQPGSEPGPGHDPSACTAGAPAYQLHHGAGDDPLPSEVRRVCARRRGGGAARVFEREGLMLLWPTMWNI